MIFTRCGCSMWLGDGAVDMYGSDRYKNKGYAQSAYPLLCLSILIKQKLISFLLLLIRMIYCCVFCGIQRYHR